MVEIKVDRQEIVFRIILSGHQKSTKFATIRSLHDDLVNDGVEDLTVIHAGGDRIVGFRWPLDEQDGLFGMKVVIDVMARPGELHTSANDVLIYRSADAIIYLDDRDPDVQAVPTHYAELLQLLESLSRKPEELPILVQTYDDASQDRRPLFVHRKSKWVPELHRVGKSEKRPIDVLDAAKAQVLSNYRAYEKELESRGLEGHIKIRDRVYECVPVDPRVVPSHDPLAGDVRLISKTNDHPRANIRRTRLLLLVALVCTIGAAIFVSMSL